MKKASESQSKQLENLAAELRITAGSDKRIGLFIFVSQVLNDIDPLSSFSSNFSHDLIMYKSQKAISQNNILISTLDNAILYYNQK